MKLTQLLPVSLAALAAAYAAPSTLAQSPGARVVKTVRAGKMQEAKLTLALNQLEDQIALGLAFDDKVDELKKVVATLPGDAEMRARMQQYLDDFANRAANHFMRSADLAVLRADFARAQLDGFLDDLARRAGAAGWTEQQVADFVQGWIYRGRAFVNAPDPAKARARFQAAVDDAIASSYSAVELILELRKAVLEDQADDAAKVLRQRRAAGTDQPSDARRLLMIMRRLRQVRDIDPSQASTNGSGSEWTAVRHRQVPDIGPGEPSYGGNGSGSASGKGWTAVRHRQLPDIQPGDASTGENGSAWTAVRHRQVPDIQPGDASSGSGGSAWTAKKARQASNIRPSL